MGKQDSRGRSRRPSWSFLNTRERRLSRREPIASIQVEMRRSVDAEKPDWAGSAVDINGSGMALVLPPELITGTRIFLTFTLGSHEFSAVPGEVLRQETVGVGALRFVDWSELDQLALVAYLQGSGLLA